MPPLILVHGASGNAATWGLTADVWDGCDVSAIDLPGRGDSPGEPARTAAEAASWLVDRMRARPAPSPPLVVGHSFGGAVALEVALAAPELVAGLVLVSSASRLRVAPAILSAVAAATPDAPLPFDFAFGPSAPAGLKVAYQALVGRTPVAASVADWRACDGFDVRHRLAEIGVPVLIVHGGDDQLTIPKHQRSLAEALPDATRVELPGVGHMAPWEDPAGVRDAIIGWWAARSTG